jgi:hypothetical protein
MNTVVNSLRLASQGRPCVDHLKWISGVVARQLGRTANRKRRCFGACRHALEC